MNLLRNKTGLLLALILEIAIFLRIRYLPELFFFGIDEEYQAWLADSLLKDFHIKIIGVSASNIGYYLGPGLTYLTTFLLKISAGDPLILGYFASCIGVLTVISLYWVGKKLWSQKVTFIATTIYGSSTFIALYDRRYWPIFIPFIVIWQLYYLNKAEKDVRWLIPSMFLIGLAYHVHLSLLLFWPFVLFIAWKQRKDIVKPLNSEKKQAKHNAILPHCQLLITNYFPTWFYILATYLIMTAPMLLFDILHNYDNLLMPVRLLQSFSTPSHSFALLNHLQYLTAGWAKVWYVQAEQNIWILASLAIVTFICIKWVMFKIKIVHKTLLVQVTILYSVAFLLFPGPAQEYYLIFFFPLFAYIVALALSQMRVRYIVPLLALFVFINLHSFNQLQKNTGLKAKKELAQHVSDFMTDKTFHLTLPGRYIDNGGWEYVFKSYGKTPTTSIADETFGWIYKKDVSNNQPEYTVTIVDKRTHKISLPYIKKISVGVYNAYITKN
jgi:hypothetical protein